MSYSSLAALAQDGQFRNRVAACAAEQQAQASADLGGIHPTGWADQHLWQIAASPGFADAYAYAIETGVQDPGASASVITDEQVLAAVQERLAEEAADE